MGGLGSFPMTRNRITLPASEEDKAFLLTRSPGTNEFLGPCATCLTTAISYCQLQDKSSS